MRQMFLEMEAFMVINANANVFIISLGLSVLR